MDWRKVAQDLKRLAEDQAGKPEGELAAEKLALILTKHPEAAEPEPAPMPQEPQVTIIWWSWPGESWRQATTDNANTWTMAG